LTAEEAFFGRSFREPKTSDLGIAAVILPSPTQEIAESATIEIEKMVKNRIARADFTR
jgi:hypothetical protein